MTNTNICVAAGLDTTDPQGRTWGWFELSQDNTIVRHGFAGIEDDTPLDVYGAPNHVYLALASPDDGGALRLDAAACRNPLLIAYFLEYHMFNVIFLTLFGKWVQCNGLHVYNPPAQPANTLKEVVS